MVAVKYGFTLTLMMKHALILMILLFLAFACKEQVTISDAGGPLGAAEKRVLSVVESALQNARDGAHERLETQVGAPEICRFLLDQEYEKAAAAERERFCSLIKEYLVVNALPKTMSILQKADLSQVSYGRPVLSGNQAQIDSAYKSFRLTWVLTRRKAGDWVITDYLRDGTSGMETNRDKQIQPGLKRYGLPGLNDRLEKSIKK
ncbi:MAG: ABC transporter substrate-binding protein [Spirochaetales bacterium]|nr:ABC transporter substrate-binding protein [Spirochaetales bacterium]